MGRYDAVHVRHGDFVAQSYTPRSGQVSCEEITRNLEQVFDGETPLALCTDADYFTFFESLFPKTFLLERELMKRANCAPGSMSCRLAATTRFLCWFSRSHRWPRRSWALSLAVLLPRSNVLVVHSATRVVSIPATIGRIILA